MHTTLLPIWRKTIFCYTLPLPFIFQTREKSHMLLNSFSRAKTWCSGNSYWHFWTFSNHQLTVSVFTKCQQFGPDRKTGTENCYSISSTTKIKTFLVILLQAKVHIIRHLLGSFFHGRAIWKNILVIQFERSSGKMEQWQELEKNIVIFQCYLTDTCNTQKRLVLVGGKIRWRIHTS